MQQATADASNPLGCNYFITTTLQGYLIAIMEIFILSPFSTQAF